MKIYLGLAAVAALSLTACKSDTADTTAEATTASEPAATTAAAAPVAAAPGSKPTKDFMVGKWGEEGDCALALEFKADGTMVGPFEKWNLEDGVLEMVGNPQKISLTVVDDKTMESQIGNDPKHKLTRCS